MARVPIANVVADAAAQGMTLVQFGREQRSEAGYQPRRVLARIVVGHERRRISQLVRHRHPGSPSDHAASSTAFVGAIGRQIAPTTTSTCLTIPAGTILKAKGENDQGGGAYPLEYLRPNCAAGVDIDYMWVKLYSAGAGTAGDVLEFQTNTNLCRISGLTSNPYSRRRSRRRLAAVHRRRSDRTLGIGRRSRATASSGPTNDNRIKPDLACGIVLSTASAMRRVVSTAPVPRRPWRPARAPWSCRQGWRPRRPSSRPIS